MYHFKGRLGASGNGRRVFKDIGQYVELATQVFSGGDIKYEVIEFKLVHYW